MNHTGKNLLNNTNRVPYFDYLRIIAVFAVILLHVTAPNLWDFIGSPGFLIPDFYSSVTRWCVPVFVMISGALFLNPEREIRIDRLFKKNLLRLITAFAFWALLYAVIDYAEGVRPRDAAYNVIRGHYHMWYIFMIAGLYLVVPILRKVTESKRLTEYFILIWAIFAVLLQTVIYLASFVKSSFSDLFAKVTESLWFRVAGGYSGYFLLGHYLNYYELTKKKKTLIYILGAAGFIMTFILPILYFKVKGQPNTNFGEYLTVNVLFESVFVFTLFKNIIKNDGSPVPAPVRTLSDCSFGIYLVHLIITEFAERHLNIDSLSFAPAISIPVISVAVFIISFIIIFIIRKIPYLNRYIV